MAASDYALALGEARERLTEELVVAVFGRKLPAADRDYATQSCLQHLNAGAGTGAALAGPAAVAAAAVPADPWLEARTLEAYAQLAERLEDACQPGKAAALRVLVRRVLEEAGGGTAASSSLALLLALAGRPEASPPEVAAAAFAAQRDDDEEMEEEEDEEEDEEALTVGLRRRRPGRRRRRAQEKQAAAAAAAASDSLSDWGDDGDDDDDDEEPQQPQQPSPQEEPTPAGWRLGAQGRGVLPPARPPLRPVPEMASRRLPLGRLARRPPLPTAAKLARNGGPAATTPKTTTSQPPPPNATLLEALLAARLANRPHAPLPDPSRCLAPAELARQALRAARADVASSSSSCSPGAFLLVACSSPGADNSSAPHTTTVAVDGRCLTPSLSQGALQGLLAAFAEAGTAFRVLDAASRRLVASQLEPRCPWTAFRGAADDQDEGGVATATAAENGAWWKPPRAAVALGRPLTLPTVATPCLSAFGEALGQQLDALRRQLAALDALPGVRREGGGGDDEDDDADDADAAASSSAAPLLEAHRLAQGAFARVRLLHSVASRALEAAAEAASAEGADDRSRAASAAASAALIDALNAQLRRAASVTGPEGEGRRRCLAHLLLRACLPLVGSLGRWLWGGRAEEDDAALLFGAGSGGDGGGGDFFVVPVASASASSSPSSHRSFFRTRAFELAGAAGEEDEGDENDGNGSARHHPGCCPAFLAPLAEDILDAGKSLRLLRYLEQQQQGWAVGGNGNDAAASADQSATAGNNNNIDDGATAAAALQRAFVAAALEALGFAAGAGKGEAEAAATAAAPSSAAAALLAAAMARVGRLAAVPERCAEAEAEAALRPLRGDREWEELERVAVDEADKEAGRRTAKPLLPPPPSASLNNTTTKNLPLTQWLERSQLCDLPSQLSAFDARERGRLLHGGDQEHRPFPPSFDAAVRATAAGAAARRLDDALLLNNTGAFYAGGAEFSSFFAAAACAAAAPGLLRRALIPRLRRRCGAVRAALMRRLVYGVAGVGGADGGLSYELEAVRNSYFLSAPALAAWADEQLLPALEAAAAAGVVAGRRRRQVSAALLLEGGQQQQQVEEQMGSGLAAPSALELVDVGQLQRALDAALIAGGGGGAGLSGSDGAPLPPTRPRDALPPPGSLQLHVDRGALARARAHQDQALARAVAERRRAMAVAAGTTAAAAPLPPLPPPPISSLELEAVSFRLRCGGGEGGGQQQQRLSLLPLVIEEDDKKGGKGGGASASSSSCSSPPSRLDPCLRFLLQLRIARRAVGTARLAAVKRRDAREDLERREAVERAGMRLAAEQGAAETRAAAGAGVAAAADGDADESSPPLLPVRAEAAALQGMAHLLAALHACVMDGLVAPASSSTGPFSAWAALERSLARARSTAELRAAHRAFLAAALRQCCCRANGESGSASSASSCSSSAAAWRHVGATLPRLFDAALSFAAAHADLLDARAEADRRLVARHARDLLPPAALPLSARRSLRLGFGAYDEEGEDEDDDFAAAAAGNNDPGGCWRPSDAPASLAAARAAACVFRALPAEDAAAAAPAEAWRAIQRHRRAMAVAAAHWREGTAYLRRVLRVQRQQQEGELVGGAVSVASSVSAAAAASRLASAVDEGEGGFEGEGGGAAAATAWPPLRDLLFAIGSGVGGGGGGGGGGGARAE